MKLKHLPRAAIRSEKARFLIVGGYNTVFGYVLFAILILLLGDKVHYLLVLVLSHVLAVTNAYFTHRLLVFRDATGGLRSYLRFHSVNLANLGFGLVALPFLVEIVQLSPILAQGLAMTVIVVLSYIFHKQFSFAK